MRCSFKYITQLAFVLFLFPTIAQAACLADGYTVVFINGIRNTREEAEQNKSELRDILGVNFNNQTIYYATGYNATHLQGGGDLVEAALPQFNEYDLQTILMQMHDEVQTRKLLLVGHSQGAVYANRLYEYLVAHGVPKESVAVYAVATPTAYVAGGGKYLNYQADTVIYDPLLQVGAVVPPLPNVLVKDWWDNPNAKGDNLGHSFIDVYLANFADRMTSDIKSQLFVLRSTNATTTGGCFEAPAKTLAYQAMGAGLAVGEPLAVGVKVTGQVGALALGGVIKVYDLAYAAAGSVFGLFGSKEDKDNDRAAVTTAFAAFKGVLGSSLDVADVNQLQKEYGDKNLGSAAMLAFLPEEPQAVPEVLGTSTQPVATTTATTTPSAQVFIDIPEAPAVFVPDPSTVHLNSPAFGGPQASQQAPAPVLVAPTIAFSNWTSPDGSQFCSLVQRTVDVSWNAVPNAAYYSLYLEHASGGPIDFGTTTGTAWPATLTFFGSDPTTVTVVAHDTGGGSATSTMLANTALVDQQPPSIISFSPAISATGIATTSAVALTFDEPLKASLVTAANFTLFKLDSIAGQIAVDSTVSLSGDGTVVTMQPNTPLTYNAGHRLAVSCAITDLVGNHPASSFLLFADLVTPYFTTEVQ